MNLDGTYNCGHFSVVVALSTHFIIQLTRDFIRKSKYSTLSNSQLASQLSRVTYSFICIFMEFVYFSYRIFQNSHSNVSWNHVTNLHYSESKFSKSHVVIGIFACSLLYNLVYKDDTSIYLQFIHFFFNCRNNSSLHFSTVNQFDALILFEKMKTSILFLIIVTLGIAKVNAGEIPQEIQGLVAGLREKCHRETGVDIEHVDRTVEGYFHPSEVLGCYFSCIFNAFDLLDHDGHLDFDKVLSRIPDSFREHGTEMIESCRHLTGKNPCDSAFNLVQCFQKTNPEKYFVI